MAQDEAKARIKRAQAIELAARFAQERNVDTSCMGAVLFHGDRWSVVLAKPQSPHFVESPGCSIVKIDDATGEASFFDVL